MIERILILVGLAAGICVVWLTFHLWQSRRARSLASSHLFADIIPPNRPAIVAFSSPGCVECRARQAPALKQLAAALGDQVTIRTLSAHDYPHLVAQLGILTVATTVVLDANGSVRRVKPGFTSAETLARQIGAALSGPQRQADRSTLSSEQSI